MELWRWRTGLCLRQAVRSFSTEVCRGSPGVDSAGVSRNSDENASGEKDPGVDTKYMLKRSSRNVDQKTDSEAGIEVDKKYMLKRLSVNPGIADKPIASPAVARFKRMAMSDEGRELLEILESDGALEMRLSEYYGRLTTDIVVDVLNHVKNVEVALFFFKWCNGRHGFVHSSFTFNRLLEFLVNKKQLKRAHEILLAEKPFPYQPNSFTYATVVRGYCEDGDTTQALALLEHMKKANVKANPKIYNILLTHLCKLGKEKEALDLLHSMTSSSCEPDVFTYNILINALCKVGRMDDAQGLVEMMEERGCPIDVITFNTLIHGLCRQGGRAKVERALKLFGDMMRKGYAPTSVTYTAVIDALLRAKMDLEAQEVLDQMRESGCVFDLITYNMLINRFGKAGVMDKAAALFHEMPSRGCIPDVISYNSIIDGYCKAGLVDEANKLFQEMQDKGLPPNGRTYTSITDACLKAGRMQEAHDYLIEMRRKDLADAISYIALISTICKLGKGTLAFQLLKEMIEKGFKPNLITFNAVYRALDSESDSEEAKVSVTELKQQLGGKSGPI